MAATYEQIAYNEQGYSDAISAIKTRLDALGIFDSTSIDASTNTLSLVYAGNTVGTITLTWVGGSTIGKMTITFGTYTASDIPVNGSYLWAGSTSNAVMFCYYGNASRRARLAICKSTAGSPMICLETPTGMIAVTYDAAQSAFSMSTVTIASNSFFSNLCGIPTVYTGADFIVAASKVYRYVDRLTGITTDGLSIIDIGGTTYLTDGVMCTSDS